MILTSNNSIAPNYKLKMTLFITSVVLSFVYFDMNSIGAEENTAKKAGTSWNPVQSDQWVATDSLGRSLPTYEEVGLPRPNKHVACFYFLWLGRHGEEGPYNISEIIKEHPEAKDDPNAPYWGQMYAPHHWGESIFGYYVGQDESVLRKHAQMLGDAGVDVICFDVTNQLTYPESYRPLFKVFSEMQKAGNKVPKVAFLCPFWNPNKVVRELWREVYSLNYYPDVWFMWKGKPLILADPDLIGSNSTLDCNGCEPVKLENNMALAQKFYINRDLKELALNSPTWNGNGCAVNFRLLDESGKTVEFHKNVNVSDNKVYSFKFKKIYPAGTYTVQLTKAHGENVGWWARPLSGDNYTEAAGKANPVNGVTWLEASNNGESVNLAFLMSVNVHDEERETILDFFTFRPSQPDYFTGPSKPNQWSWLEAYPQHEYYNDKGELEEMCVGVAQNAVDGKLSVLSNPRAYGRSYHDGVEPAPEDCDYLGRNFQEQWERALKVDPEIVFITGWNEWIAGRFDINAPFHDATPVSFVDQFNEEFSRDCEPMKGGHGDAYYYQMISNIRRFKGVSKQENVKTRAITIDGSFDDWKDVTPKFYDTISDPVHRNCRGWGVDQNYVNETGRNDFVEARISYDEHNLYFYVKTNDDVVGNPSSLNWISLLLDTDEDPTTGANGNDYIVHASQNGKELELVATIVKDGMNQIDQSIKATPVEFKVFGSEIELKIPFSSIQLTTKESIFRFKWTDGIDVLGEWLGFTTDGDAAPNDRYYYRYTVERR